MTGGGDDMWVGSELEGAATGVRIGPVPVERIEAAGRRIRRRRRTAVGALALASAVVLGGGVAAGLHATPAGARTGKAVGPAAGASASASASVPAVGRDPFTPVRVVIGQGTVDGKEWKLWEALWPLAPQDRAYQQALAVWQERSAVDPSLTRPTEDYVRQYWQPTEDVVNTYATLDGVRQKYDDQGSYPAPGRLDPQMADTFAGGVLGPRDKDSTPGPLPIRLAVLSLGPDVGKVVVTWTDGTTLEPEAVTVGDSPYRRLVVAEQPGKKVASWRFYGKDGRTLPDAGMRLLAE